MSLKVKVKSAADLPNIETIGKSDPFVVLKFRDLKKETKVIDNELNPVWNEDFEWSLQAPLGGSEVLNIEVYDKETIGKNRLLGSTDYPLRELWKERHKSAVLKLKPSKKAGKHDKATIALEFQHVSLSDRKGVGVDGAAAPTPASTGGDTDELNMNESGGDIQDADTLELGGGEEKGITSGSPEIRLQGTSVSRRRRKRIQLPDRELDFQIHVHVIECRKLEGNNISPLVKVSCGSLFKKTTARKGTNQPVFDDTLVFKFKQRPVELFEKKIELKVMNTERLSLQNATIGTFMMDVGTVYYEPDHCIQQKWLLLIDYDNPTGEAKGFLKASIRVLGPDDDPVDLPSTVSADDVDIEANLLRPSGARLQPATLVVKIYAGEDLPQMDPAYFQKFKRLLNISDEQKELVDPYALVSFAGHQGSTDVKWNTQHPEWKEQINLGYRFPSVCDRIRLQLKDKDKYNADDFICTGYINIPEISAPGEDGFLPSFGPAYINMYGSPREFSDFPDKYEHLNIGKLDGVAYRGRVLLEIETVLGSLPALRKECISATECRKLQVFQRRKKYRLFAIFMSASLIYPGKKNVEFEVSIGNYGNKLETTIVKQPSTTKPEIPTYDGNSQYFLNWGRNKPCLMVDSIWEDCEYRIETLNYLLSIVDYLADGLKDIRRRLRLPKAVQEDLERNVIMLCNKLIEQLIDFLPGLPSEGYTKLDKHLRLFREKELASLCPEIDIIIATTMSLEERLSRLDVILERLTSLAVEPQNSVPDVVVWMLSGNKRVAYYRIPSHQLMYSGKSSRYCGKHCGRQLSLLLKPPAAKNQKELEDNQNEALLQMMFWLGFEDDVAESMSSSGLERRGTPDHEDSHELLSSRNTHSPGGEIVTYAETYENESFLGIRWGYIGKKLQRPHWSDAAGKVKQKKEYFDPPPEGWVWDGDWFKHPEHGNDDDSDVSVYTVVLYEVQTREIGDIWPPAASSRWSDDSGVVVAAYDGEGKEVHLTQNDIDLPPGWEWTSRWTVDLQTSATDDGWTYSMEHYDPDEGFAEEVVWVPFERSIDLTRRRRWYRTRHKTSEAMSRSEQEVVGEGWEYAGSPGSVYHTNRNTLDFFRRRRWHRKLRAIDFGKPCVFHFKNKKMDRTDSAVDLYEDPNLGNYQTPRMYLEFPKQNYSVFQLRAYLYQARSIYGADSSGLSDAYAVVSCEQKSATSRVMSQSLVPQWNETLLIDSIKIYGNPDTVAHAPPAVVVKFYDKDTIGQNEYLGRIVVKPAVRLTSDWKSTTLEWFEIERHMKPAGELLGAFELIRTDSDEFSPLDLKRSETGTYFEIPADVLPVMKKKRVEVLCWGVRDVKRLLALPVKHPYAEIEVGGIVKQTGVVRNAAKNPLFENPFILTLDVEMPVEDVYSPPLNIKVYDKRMFGHTPLVGSYVINSLKEYEETGPVEQGLSQLARALTMRRQPSTTATDSVDHPESQHTVIDMSISADKMKETFSDEVELKYDWWSKYYASVKGDESRIQEGYIDEGQDKLVVYNKPLEDHFDHFEDFVHTFPLFRGKGGRPVGYFKGALKVYDSKGHLTPETPKLMSSLPIKWPQEVVVRVYVIRGFDLAPQDIGGKSDPYVSIKIGKRKVVNNKEEYIPNELNPVFGKMFELEAVLPFDRKMTVTVMDHDLLSADDVIGSTDIDLENRFLSLHHAHIGLPETFQIRGANRWRSHMLPSDTLTNMCKLQRIPQPVWTTDTQVTFKNKEYTLEAFEQGKIMPKDCLGEEKERLALYVLQQENLVPEHIEKRPLFNSVQPGVPQGYIHLWVDLFPKIPGSIIPPPLDIAPRKPEKYVLRLVVWNTADVLLDERSPIADEAMSDIYVKGWLTGSDDIQKTDTHYRCTDGDGMFNWRLVYSFDYLATEKKMVTHVKEHFYSLDKTERRLPVRFNLQVWDDDLISQDDFLGKVEFDLHDMPKLAKSKRRCGLRQLDEEGSNRKRINLFEQKHIKGWIPVFQEVPQFDRREHRNNKTCTGKVEIEMEVMTEAEEKMRPAGKGQEDPNMYPFLEKPNRPETSFAFFASPLKTFKHIVWKHHKCKVIFGGIFLFILISILMLL